MVAVFPLVLAVVAQGPAVAAPTAEQLGRAYALFLQGQALDDQDDLSGAAARYRQALELVPGSAEIRAELAGVLARQGEAEPAQREAERALVVDAANRTAHRVLGLMGVSSLPRTQTLNGTDPQVAGVLNHLERAISGGVQDLSVQLTLGDLYVRTGQHDRAISVLRSFLDARPNYPQALLLLAQAYRASGRTDEASAVFESLGLRAESAASSLVSEAEALERSGKWREAAELWGRIAAEAPAEVSHRHRQAAAFANANDFDAARQVLTRLTEQRADDVSAWYLLVQVEQRRGDLAAADRAAARIVALDPEDPRGPLALAEVRSARGDARGVIAALEGRVASASASDLASGAYTEMVTALSRAYLEAREPKRAVETLERARQRAPDDHELLFRLAAMYEQTKDYDRAERTFRDLIEADPDHDRALNYLGYMLADRGRKLSEAVTFITRALALDQDNPSYLDSLGWAYFRLERYDEALSPLERAAADVPDSSVIQDHLGDLYFELKRYSDAAAAFDRALAGDRDGIDMVAITKKRDRARALSGQR
jgi:tetratricopeptide (TPR) repeat protein